jgi:hypothetical protein
MSSPDHRAALYAEAGANYRSIDDLRLRLMALLPLATGTGIFLLLRPEGAPNASIIVPAGVFGVLATLSLFFYELHGFEKCAHFIHRAQQIEESIGVRGAFTARPHNIFGIVSELLPAAVVYPASLAGWLFVALASLTGKVGRVPISYLITSGVLVLGVAAAMVVIFIREHAREAEWAAEDRRYEQGTWPGARPQPDPCPRLSQGTPRVNV